MFLGWSKEQKRILGPVQKYYWASPKPLHAESAPLCVACVAGATKMLLVQPKYGPSCELHIITMICFLFFVFVICITFVLSENNGQKRPVEFLCFLHFPSWQTCWANAKKHGESKIWSVFKDMANMKKHKLS